MDYVPLMSFIAFTAILVVGLNLRVRSGQRIVTSPYTVLQKIGIFIGGVLLYLIILAGWWFFIITFEIFLVDGM
jgi:hypothetical protein